MVSQPKKDKPAAGSEAYAARGRALNLLIKDNHLARAAREAALLAAGSGLEGLAKDAELTAPIRDGTELGYYVNGKNGGHYDARNFPEFTAGNSYLGPRQYFAMGDNRYYSNIDPFALELRYIEGYAAFRVWPPARFGAIE
jgi:hypothetical protein